MQRCLQLAEIGRGNVAPNPMVGAVLVYHDQIIGEGYHQQYGGTHAEVNCFNSVKSSDEKLVEASALYVSLEPCAHFGKTPPCADLIIQKKVKKVVVACRDPFEQVNGKGIEKLKAAGIEIVSGVCEEEAQELNKRFFIFHQLKRPYIVLKWAQTNNKVIGLEDKRLLISNDVVNKIVHTWRSDEAAILVGTKTVLTDNPKLNARLATGKNPVRLVIDKALSIPGNFHIYDRLQETVVFNVRNEKNDGCIKYTKLDNQDDWTFLILKWCYENKLQSILVEGGTKLLQSFLDKNIWDEARVITNLSMHAPDGIQAPNLKSEQLITTEQFEDNRIQYFRRVNS
ncbi:MAG: ribD [Chitinophagaceae bacterium]|nr:ribD [Chitinophagaceae bacterium]